MPDFPAVVNNVDIAEKKRLTPEEKVRAAKEKIEELKRENDDLKDQIKKLRQKKLPSGAIFEALFDELIEDQKQPDSAFVALNGYRLAAYELEPGIKQFILQTEGPRFESISVEIARAQQLFLEYVRFIHSYEKNYQWTSETALSYAKYHYARLPCIEKPALIRQLNDPYPTFKRIPWELMPSEGGAKTPLFNEFMSRITTNKRAFKAWIWSIFELKSYPQQYLYLQGEGHDGKSAFASVLLRLLGSVATAQSSLPSERDQFRYSPFLNKRLAIFTDLPRNSSLSDNAFKALTGLDYVFIRRLYKEGYAARLDCKVFNISNHDPCIEDGGNADLRRPIWCKIKTTTAFDPYYEQKLYDELKYYLHDCREEYYSLAPSHGAIPTDEDQNQLLKDELDNRNQDFVRFFEENLLEVEPSYELRPGAFDKRTWITPGELRERLFYRNVKNPLVLAKFNLWLKNSRGYEKERGDALNQWVIHGINLKNV